MTWVIFPTALGVAMVVSLRNYSASAPEMISISSLVIIA
jgi:hypothetical protein